MDLSTREVFDKAAEKAVSFARKSGVELDYTNESIERVEKLLSQFYDEFQVGQPPAESEYASVANTFGPYVGNTLIRNLGKGEWIKGAGDAWVVLVDDHQYLFPAKVYRRLKNGPEDNVVALYLQAYNSHSENKINLKLFEKNL